VVRCDGQRTGRDGGDRHLTEGTRGPKRHSAQQEHCSQKTLCTRDILSQEDSHQKRDSLHSSSNARIQGLSKYSSTIPHTFVQEDLYTCASGTINLFYKKEKLEWDHQKGHTPNSGLGGVRDTRDRQIHSAWYTLYIDQCTVCLSQHQ